MVKKTKRKSQRPNRMNYVLNGLISVLVVVLMLFGYSFIDNFSRAKTAQRVYSGNLEDIPTASIQNQEDLQQSRDLVIQILNGCGISGLSKELKDYLGAQGVDVRNVGNANQFNYNQSKLYIHSHNYDKANEFNRIIGVELTPEYRQAKAGEDYEFTLVVGNDYLSLKPFSTNNQITHVEILNGCGAPGLSHRFQSYFTEKGFSVKNVDNADHFNYPKTKIIIYNRMNRKAVELGAQLGIKDTEIQYIDDNNSEAYDICIILGADYYTLKPYRNSEM